MNGKEPLGLPAGSIRAIITLILLGTCISMLFVDVVDAAQDIRSGVLALTVMAVQQYFTSRQPQNQQETGDVYVPVREP